jgi:hypothetical protein
MPALVEFAVGRQMDFRDRAKDVPAMDRHRAVEQPSLVLQWRAHDQERQQIAGAGRHGQQRALHGIEQGILLHQVLDCVAREEQLGKYRQRHALCRAGGGAAQHRFGAGSRVGDMAARRAGRDPHETVAVKGREGLAHADSCFPVQEYIRAVKTKGQWSAPCAAAPRTQPCNLRSGLPSRDCD